MDLNNFTFPFDIKLVEVRQNEWVVNTAGDYEKVVLGDCNGGYIRAIGNDSYDLKERISCNSYMYDKTVRYALVVASEHTLASLEKKALFNINSFGGIVKEVITNREQVIKEERLGEIRIRSIIKVVFEFTDIYINDCSDVDLDCDC